MVTIVQRLDHETGTLLRREPNPDAVQDIGEVPNQAQVLVLGLPQNGYQRVRYQQLEGFINRTYLSGSPQGSLVDGIPVSFACYNVLAPWTEGGMCEELSRVFDRPTMHALLNYSHPSGLRRANVASLLDEVALTVLVEVERQVVDDVLSRARERGSPFQREIGWRHDEQMEWGSAVLWRQDVFEKVGASVGSLATGRFSTQTYTAVLLRLCVSGALLCVVAVHLKAGDMDLERVREKQARMAVEGAEALLHSTLGDGGNAVPIVVAGDFNSDRRHPSARVGRLMRRLGFSDAGAGSEARTIKHGGDAIFDYIFTRGRSVRTSGYWVKDDVKQDISPNLTEGSDHLPVLCTLEFDGVSAS